MICKSDVLVFREIRGQVEQIDKSYMFYSPCLSGSSTQTYLVNCIEYIHIIHTHDVKRCVHIIHAYGFAMIFMIYMVRRTRREKGDN